MHPSSSVSEAFFRELKGDEEEVGHGEERSDEEEIGERSAGHEEETGEYVDDSRCRVGHHLHNDAIKDDAKASI